MKRLLSLLFLAVFLFVPAVSTHAATWYVKTEGTDPGDCTGGHSWSEAYQTIQEAIDCADPWDEIWVKQGTYDISSDQIEVDKAVDIYGGFDGTELTLGERDWAANVTTVDGNDAIYHCFYVAADATIDGFTITGGNAIGSSFPDNGGGGVCNDACDPLITNCTFYGNSGYGGGGILNYNSSNATITNCTLAGNSANAGGGILNYDSSNATITNCTLSGNSAGCGGGIYNDSSSPAITNTILWGDSATDGQEIYDFSGSAPTVTYCDVQGGYSGTGNIDTDPRFRDISDPDEANWDLHLQPDSPCIDTGTNAAPSLPDYDFEGDDRIINGTVDIGADEFVPVYVILHKDGALWLSDTGWVMGSPPYYAGSDYARDLEYLDDGDYLILHKDGALYDSGVGWTMTAPPYYAGSNYAVDLEVTATDADCILDRDGALWYSDTGWVLTSPPYYSASDYARALELRADTSYVILHQYGGLYDSASGWVLTSPPYYAGSAWVVDMKLEAGGYVLLHQDGGLWSTSGGWVLTSPPYYAGSGYARALEMVGTDYVILHKDGALYDSAGGWNMASPPYYPGSNYAVDLEVQ